MADEEVDCGGKGDVAKGGANGAMDDEMKKQAAFCKEHVACEEEKTAHKTGDI